MVISPYVDDILSFSDRVRMISNYSQINSILAKGSSWVDDMAEHSWSDWYSSYLLCDAYVYVYMKDKYWTPIADIYEKTIKDIKKLEDKKVKYINRALNKYHKKKRSCLLM